MPHKVKPAESKAKGQNRDYHHRRLKTALLAAALEILERQGIGAVTLRGVARRAGVSHAAPYHHFAGKAALLAAVAANGYLRLVDAISSAQNAAGPSPQNRFTALGRAYVRFAVEHPELFRLMFRPEVTHPAEHPELREAERRAFGMLAGTLEALDRTGQLAPGGLAVCALSAWSTVHGLSLLLIDRVLEETPLREAPLDKLADRVNQIIVESLTTRRASR